MLLHHCNFFSSHLAPYLHFMEFSPHLLHFSYTIHLSGPRKCQTLSILGPCYRFFLLPKNPYLLHFCIYFIIHISINISFLQMDLFWPLHLRQKILTAFLATTPIYFLLPSTMIILFEDMAVMWSMEVGPFPVLMMDHNCFETIMIIPC